MGRLSIIFTLLLLQTTASASDFFAVRQLDTLGNASFSLIDTADDRTITTSELSFAYKRPHVESTATDQSTYYVVGFPLDDSNGAAHLWLFDSNLNVEKEWVQPADGLMFFDLQYSSLQSELFGIAVNGTYGRVISQFDISGDDVTATYIVACPYMWYVNASSFDHENDMYYGLLNNFEDTSLGQKLIVVNVKDGTSTVYDYAVSDDQPLLYFITFTPHGLYAMASETDYGYAQLGYLTFDQTTDTLTFDSVTTFNGPLAKYSPIFYCMDSTDNTNGYGQVCSALGGSDGVTPKGLGCFNLYSGGQPVYVVNGLTAGGGNVNAVAFYA